MLERLQKIIAHAGIASRRHAEQLILSGQVLVNGQIVRELGTKADPTVDKIEAAGRLVEEARKPVYLIMHKPPEVVPPRRSCRPQDSSQFSSGIS